MTIELTDEVTIRLADWANDSDGQIVVSLLESYARDPMGGAEPLSQFVKDNLAQTMAITPGAFSVIAFIGETPVALANCFTTVSTFACKPIVNIHDLAVVGNSRGRGIGQKMLQFVQDEAAKIDACKVTLEVLTGNARAVKAYERFGFKHYTLDETTGHAVFMHKSIV